MYVPSRPVLLRIAGFVGLYGAFFYYQGYVASPARPLVSITGITIPVSESLDGLTGYRQPIRYSEPASAPGVVLAQDQDDTLITESLLDSTSRFLQRQKYPVASHDAWEEEAGVQWNESVSAMRQDSGRHVSKAFLIQPVSTRQAPTETFQAQPLTLDQQYALESQRRKSPGCPSFLTPSMINEYNYLTLQAMGCNPDFTY